MGCSFKTDKSIAREKFTLLLYVVYVVVCFSLSDNIYLINNSKFYCRISALPAQQGGETGSRGPWGFFAEYWIFEVWLPWTKSNCDQTNYVMIKTVCKIQQCRSSRSSEPSTSARSSWRRHNGRNLTATSFHLLCTADLCILKSTKSSMFPIPLRSSILPIPSISPRLPIPSRSIFPNSYFWSKNTIF